MFPIKLASNLLVFGCIAVTAVICSTLAAISAEGAISKTEKNRDSSVDQCFDFTSGAMWNKTNDYLQLLYGNLNNVLSEHFATQQSITEILLTEMLAGSDEDLESWDYLWSKRSIVRNVYAAHRKSGVAAIGVSNKDTALLMLFQSDEDFGGGILAHDALIMSNGSKYYPTGTPIENRTAWGTVEEFTGDFVTSTPQYAPCVEWKHNPGVPMKPCYGDPKIRVAHAIQNFGISIPRGIENIIFSVPVPLVPYIVVLGLGTYYNSKNEYMGVAYVASDIRQVSQALRGLNIPGKGRVYCLVKENNWLNIPVGLHMTAASHGKSGERAERTNVTTIPATEASDRIIRETANYIENQFIGKYESKVGKGTFEISIDTGDGHEIFFVSVNSFNNGREVDWYVITALDKNYILGDVERTANTTRNVITTSSKQVSNDREHSRLVIILIITSTGSMLLLIAFFAISAVTSPILALKREMASVAIMRLEDVNENRPLSSLTEVGEMQISFIQMISNLKEYRNFIPQSVLVESQSEDGTEKYSDTITKRSALSNSRSSATSNTSNLGGDVSNIRISYVVKQRRVSIAITNVIGFSSEANNINDHREYLTRSLDQCTSNGGIADGFSGDRFTMMFNGPRTCGNHSVQSVITCKAIISSAPFKISASTATGTAKCGNIGCEGLKKFSVIGCVFSVANALERVNRILNTNLVCCPIAERDIATEFHTRIEDQLWYPKYKRSNSLIIYSVLGEKKVAAEEWMYQLESEAKHPTKAYNEIMELYLAELYHEALERASGNSEFEDLVKKITKAKDSKINTIRFVSSELI